MFVVDIDHIILLRCFLENFPINMTSFFIYIYKSPIRNYSVLALCTRKMASLQSLDADIVGWAFATQCQGQGSSDLRFIWAPFMNCRIQ